MRLLLADDEPIVLRLLVRVLRGAGWDVLTAASGEELVAVWKDRPCDVVLSDVSMPGSMDGIEACRELRKIDPRARIFMMTGDWDGVLRAEEFGFPIALRKPFTVEEIQAWAQTLSR